MTIPEACNFVLETGAMGQGGEAFVFDMGQPVKILDMAKKMVKLSGLELEKDIKIEITGLRLGEKLYEELLGALKKPSLHTIQKFPEPRWKPIVTELSKNTWTS